MGDWPVIQSVVGGSIAGLGVAVSTNASANTKGNWAQLVASTAFAANLLVFRCDNALSTFDYLIDIGIGAEGSETVILSNLIRSAGLYTIYDCIPFYAPLSVPAGSRISARAQSSTGGKTIYTSLNYYGASVMKLPLSVCETYGASTADSGGVEVDCGTSAWTKGAYAEITASTLRAISGVVIGIGNKSNSIRAQGNFYIDLAIGAGSSEQVILQIATGISATASSFTPNFSCFYPISIAAGSRLAVRAMCGTTDATDRLFDVVLYCFS